LLTNLFESVGLKEGVNFKISPDIMYENSHSLRDKDLVLLCGPARNHILHELGDLHMRYSMKVANDGSNILEDTFRGSQQMLTSRELPPSSNSEKFDYGIIASLPNPINHERKLVVLAGVHGTGTVGATEFVTTGEGLLNLRKTPEIGGVCELVKAVYREDVETPTELKLV
jgi:hypothetical protein